MEEQFFPNEEDVLGPGDEARVSDEANAAKAQGSKDFCFEVIGVAEDRDGPSEGVNYQPQRKDATSVITKRKRAQYEEPAKGGNDVAAHVRSVTCTFQ
uniref:Uncharacterized protein n=1 Tax=Ascaris lumbricoides TaxID=6252 RepID=A0A9J2PH39_ASCLU